MDIITARLTEHDAWGKPRTIDVEWIPLDITELVDPARLNIRPAMRIIAHATVNNPPVFLQRHAVGWVGMYPVRQSFSGEFSHVTEFGRVDRREDLEPGYFFVASDSDEV